MSVKGLVLRFHLLYGVLPALALPAGKSLLTLHTNMVSWSRASQICQQDGGRLVRADSRTIRTTLSDFMTGIWKSNINYGDYWIGAFVNETRPGAYEYLWSGLCDDVTGDRPWATNSNEPDWLQDQRCIRANAQSSEWRTTKCSYKFPFVCEHSKGFCTFCEAPDTTWPNRSEIISSSRDSQKTSQEDCMLLCQSAAHGKEPCWGATYSLDGNCQEFFSEAQPEDYGQSYWSRKVGGSLYIRTCYDAELNTATSNYHGDAQTPASTCHPYNVTSTDSTVLVCPNAQPVYMSTSDVTSDSSLSTTPRTEETFTGQGTQYAVLVDQSSESMKTSLLVSEAAMETSLLVSEAMETSLLVSEAMETSLLVSEAMETSLLVSEAMETSLLVSEALETSLLVSEAMETPLLVSETTAYVYKISSRAAVPGPITPPDEGQLTCPCPCVKKLSAEESSVFMSSLLNDLSLNTSSTAAFRRKRESADDGRPSARGIGYSGAIIIGVVFGALLIMDFTTLQRDITKLLRLCRRPGKRG